MCVMYWRAMPCCAVLCLLAADEGIPDFWLTAITNHDLIGEYVTERDAEVRAPDHARLQQPLLFLCTQVLVCRVLDAIHA